MYRARGKFRDASERGPTRLEFNSSGRYSRVRLFLNHCLGRIRLSIFSRLHCRLGLRSRVTVGKRKLMGNVGIFSVAGMDGILGVRLVFYVT